MSEHIYTFLFYIFLSELWTHSKFQNPRTTFLLNVYRL